MGVYFFSAYDFKTRTFLIIMNFLIKYIIHPFFNYLLVKKILFFFIIAYFLSICLCLRLYVCLFVCLIVIICASVSLLVGLFLSLFVNYFTPMDSFSLLFFNINDTNDVQIWGVKFLSYFMRVPDYVCLLFLFGLNETYHANNKCVTFGIQEQATCSLFFFYWQLNSKPPL